ncbi:MAG: uroporphyrinogen-III C-methyltransferase [Dehalococcoidia bacterium]|nr:uroporphyrinogen-III C-methyltransferase [Dehalococcoidia bacterium]
MSATSGVGHVWLVGAGPGDPGLITVAGLAALRRAEVVLYDRLAPPQLLEACDQTAVLIDAGKAAGDHAMTQEQINAVLVEHARAGRRVVRLKGGDPFVFGRGSEELLALAAVGIAATVVPGVSSAIGGLAAAGVPVTHRGVASSFAVITGHEDPTKAEAAVHWERLATAVDTLVVLMGVGRLDAIVAALIAGGRSGDTPAALVQEATTADQRSVEAPLARIAQTAREAGIKAPALLVVGEVVRLRARLAGATSPLARRRVLVTRTRGQASTLVELLRAEGAVPVVLPAIELERRADPAAVWSSLARLRAGGYAWAVFTSANAAEVYLDLIAECGADARAFAGCRLCAIGPATARALAARGLRADLVAEQAAGEGVVAALRAQGIAGASVLLPRAEGGPDALPAGLREAGASVDELPLYLSAPPATAPPKALALVRAGKIDAVTFTSSSTVRNLAALLGGDLSPLRGATIACIGPMTAQAAAEAGLPPQVVAEEQSVAGLVAALRAQLASGPRPEVTP